MNLRRYLGYYYDCYKVDKNNSLLQNIFEVPNSHRLFLEDKEILLNGVKKTFEINPKKGLIFKKNSILYQKEKELLYCSLFITGNILSSVGKSISICSPLLFTPINMIEEDTSFYISLEKENLRINFNLISILIKSNEILHEFIEEFHKKFDNRIIDEEGIKLLIEILNKYIPNLNTNELLQYPEFYSKEEMRNEFDHSYQYKNNMYKILPVSIAAFVNKSDEIIGILDEIEIIMKEDEFSKPMKILFNEEEDFTEEKIFNDFLLSSVILDDSQIEVLESSCANPITIVKGPPGTGKSYNIAAIALEYLAMGKSVLITSKMDYAVNVLYNKILNHAGFLRGIINTCDKDYLFRIEDFLEDLLSNVSPVNIRFEEQYNKVKKRIDELNKIIRNIGKEIKSRNIKEIKWGKYVKRTKKSRFNPLVLIKNKFINLENNSKVPYSDLIQILDESLNEKKSLILELIHLNSQKFVKESLMVNREKYSDFLRIIKLKIKNNEHGFINEIDYSLLLEIIPIWLCKTSDIHNVLTCNNELFDLAIIDEATQCDIPGCIPIFQRAKKIIISGDPKQLKHISFIPDKLHETVINKYELSKDELEKYDYKTKNILDLTNDMIVNQQKKMFLDKHYRSVPQIIEFSNKEFYDNSIKIMNANPKIHNENHLILKYCNGEFTKNRKNYKEAVLLLDDVMKIIEDERNLEKKLCHSIGILSPFREHVNYIFDRLSEQIDILLLKKHDVLAGTVQTFQGDERDVMFVSFAVSPDSEKNYFSKINIPDSFNVSITRARSMQYIYTSLKSDDIKENTLLKRFLKTLEEKEGIIKDETEHYARDFLEDVTEELKKLGIKIHPAHSIAGLKLGLVIEYAKKSFGIDLIGYPGIFKTDFSVNKYKLYHSAGLKIFPLSYTKWFIDKKRAISDLKKLVAYKK